MFKACKLDTDLKDFNTGLQFQAINGFREKITATGTTWASGYYWMNREPAPDLTYYRGNIDLTLVKAAAVFEKMVVTTPEYMVLGCLVF